MPPPRQLVALAALCAAASLSFAAHAQDAGPTDGGEPNLPAGASTALAKNGTAQRRAINPPEANNIAQRLAAIYAEVERFRHIRVNAAHGVVKLSGGVRSGDDADDAVELARKLEGVIFVENKLSEPVAVSDRLSPLRERFERWIASVIDLAPLVAIALAALFLALLLGRAVSSFDFIFKRLVRKPILQDVARRLTRLLFFIVGVLIALEIIGATGVVGTILGAAGVVGLTVGFAFRDIAENYLASFLLIGRRPFAIGDLIKVDEHEGKVMRLTMRETVLMTLDGNHLSLPNATVFKARVLNYTRNPRRRFDFVVGAGVDTDLLMAQQLGVETLLNTPGVIEDPKAWAQIEELGDSNVAIRFYAWVDQREADFFKVWSEAIRRVKTAMDDAGVDMPEPIYRVNLKRTDSHKSAQGTSTEPLEADVDLSPDDTIDREIESLKDEEKNLLT